MLLNKKRILTRTVFERISKEQLPQSALEDPVVRNSVEQLGYYDVAHEITHDQKKILDDLVKLGYVDMRRTRINKVWLNHVSFLYYPDLKDGLQRFVLNFNIISSSKYAFLEDDELEEFQRAIDRFQRERSIGHHPHVKQLNYGIEFSYETDVYEIKNKYFDAILLGCSNCRLIVSLVEPYIVFRITRGKRRDRKKWRVIKEINGDLFLKGSHAIDKYIEELEWKTKADGYLIVDDVAYVVNPRASPKSESFLDKYPITVREIENWYAHEFERATAEFVRDKYGYHHTRVNFRPPYLEGKELDVYAMKFGRIRHLTLIECKLRIYDEFNPITVIEVASAKEVMQKIEDYEKKKAAKEGYCLKIYKWILTNSKTIQSEARALLDESKIKVKRALLPPDWLGNPRNLRIIDIEDLS